MPTSGRLPGPGPWVVVFKSQRWLMAKITILNAGSSKIIQLKSRADLHKIVKTTKYKIRSQLCVETSILRLSDESIILFKQLQIIAAVIIDEHFRSLEYEQQLALLNKWEIKPLRHTIVYIKQGLSRLAWLEPILVDDVTRQLNEGLATIDGLLAWIDKNAEYFAKPTNQQLNKQLTHDRLQVLIKASPAHSLKNDKVAVKEGVEQLARGIKV